MSPQEELREDFIRNEALKILSKWEETGVEGVSDIVIKGYQYSIKIDPSFPKKIIQDMYTAKIDNIYNEAVNKDYVKEADTLAYQLLKNLMWMEYDKELYEAPFVESRKIAYEKLEEFVEALDTKIPSSNLDIGYRRQLFQEASLLYENYAMLFTALERSELDHRFAKIKSLASN